MDGKGKGENAMENGMKLTIYFLALAVYLGMNLAALIAMWADKRRAQRGAVSYTHLTLPTKA